ncbi:MAG: ABC transporter ATP-binding protein [Phycisphaerae bacterium]|nr:ABC transporter ATP-binding protein [Phycisphaerae bacterium]
MSIVCDTYEPATNGQAGIELAGVSLRFRRYADQTPSFRQTILNAVLRRNYSSASEFWLYRDLNLSIAHGERVGVIGRNGAGKTTLLKVILGIYTPTAGRVRVRGLIAPLIELTAGLNIELSGWENIFLMGSLLGLSTEQMKQRAGDILRFAELEDFAGMPMKYFSAGMKMRLVFSIATGVPNEIMLMDEVFAAGDAGFISKATDRMHELVDSSHIVVFASHNISLVKKLTTRVIWLERGRIVADGDPASICDDYLAHMAAEQGSRP